MEEEKKEENLDQPESLASDEAEKATPEEGESVPTLEEEQSESPQTEPQEGEQSQDVAAEGGESNQEDASNDMKQEKPQKKSMMGIIIGVLLIIVIILVLVLNVGSNASVRTQGAVVALVNGEKIHQGEIESRFERLRPVFEQAGADFSSEEARSDALRQVLDDIIGERLLIAEAENSGVSIPDLQVEAQLNTLREQFGGEEAFLEQLELQGLVEADIRDDIKNQLLLQSFIDTEINPASETPSDEDIEAFYNDLSGQLGEPVPTLEEVRAQIIQALVQQNIQNQLTAFVEQLRASADVEVFEFEEEKRNVGESTDI